MARQFWEGLGRSHQGVVGAFRFRKFRADFFGRSFLEQERVEFQETRGVIIDGCGWDGLGRISFLFFFHVFISKNHGGLHVFVHRWVFLNLEIVLIYCMNSYQNQTHQTLPDSPDVNQPSISAAVMFSGEGNSIDLSQSPCTPCPIGEATGSNVSNEKEATCWGSNAFSGEV